METHIDTDRQDRGIDRDKDTNNKALGHDKRDKRKRKTK